MRTVDAHLHLWDPALGVYTWLTPDLGPLHARFTADDAAAELSAAGIDAAVLVQAADHALDTEAMLAVAAERDWVAGVVGWIDLEAPDRARDELDRLTDLGPLVGIRQLVHDDPRAEVYALPAVRATAAVLADRDLPLDIPDAFPRDLPAATALAGAVDGLTVVLDHLGKPPRDPQDWATWSSQLREFAAMPSTVAKISGLAVPGHTYDVASLLPSINHALECFGAYRLMLGSDWPITVAGVGYPGTHAVLTEIVERLSPAEQDALRGDTATRVYHLAEDR